jgi:hypothetical protein
MREMLAALAKYRPDQKPDVYLGGGWAIARSVHALLERAVASGDLSRAGIMRASDSLGTVSFGGIQGDYRYGPAASREPPRATHIFRVNPAVPNGLEVERANFTTPAAQKFTFEKRQR